MNLISKTISIISILCFLLFGSASISSASWSPIGPGGGGWIPAITVTNDAAHTIYVACDVGGIYKSTDHGRTWQIKNNGLTTYYVQDIACDPATPSILYAATRGGIFKSTNGGESWQSKRSGFPDENTGHFSAPVSDIIVDPQTPNIIYAGIGVPRSGYELDSFYWQECEVKGSIYKSSDSGEHWTRIYNTGIPTNAMIYSLAIDPNHANILFAATSEGVYTSSDQGATWTAKNTGLPDHLRVMGLVINPADTNTLYVTLWAKPSSTNWQGGVYKSSDGGENWTAKITGLPQTMGSVEGMTSNYPVIVIDPLNPQTLYIGNNSWTPDPGIYKTTDGGEHWTWISRDEPPNQNVDLGWITKHGVAVKSLAIDPQTPDRLYFGTSTHVFTTDNGGDNWTQAYTQSVGNGYWQGNGMETTCLQEVVVDPTDSQRIYAGYWDMGFLKSIDGGRSFKRTSGTFEYGENTFSIIVDPDDTKTLYASFGWWGEDNRGGVWKSSDYGESWQERRNGLPNAQVWSIAMDTSSPPDSRILYAASYKNGIYKTTDGGQNWVAINNGLGVESNLHVKNLQVRKIVVDPNNPSILYAGIEAKHIEDNNDMSTVQGGLFKSTDGGGSWTRIDASLPQLSVWDIEVVPGNSQTIYTAVSSEYDHSKQREFPGGVYKSVDGGTSWQKMNSGFGGDENLEVLSLALSPASPDILYAATSDAPYHDNSSGRGIFQSTDGGANWTPINKGLSVLNFSSITVDPSNPSLLYAGSGGNGIFRGRWSTVFAEELLAEPIIDQVSFIKLDFSKFPQLPQHKVPVSGAIFVSLNGSDETGNGSEAKPWQSLHHALNQAGDGAVIVVRAGDYYEQNESLDYRALVVEHPGITLMSYPEETVNIYPANDSVRYGIEVAADNFSIMGINLYDFAADGITFVNSISHNMVVAELSICNCGEGIVKHDGLLDGLLVYKVDLKNISLIGIHCGNGTGENWRIEKSSISMTATGGGSGADAFAIEHGNNILLVESEFCGAAADGIDIKGSEAVIYSCKVHNIDRNGIKLWQGGDVINCLVHHTGADAAIVGEAGSRLRLLNCTIGYHNFGGDTSYNMSFGYDTTGTTSFIEIINCIIFNTSGGIYFNPDYSVTIENSLFYNMENGRIFEHGSHVAEINQGLAGFIGYGSHNQIGDPLLAADFRPSPDSPALDSGLASVAPEFDIERTKRPVNNDYDLGVYEYNNCNLIWNGLYSYDWNNQANWDFGVSPASYDCAYIVATATAPEITTSADIGGLLIANNCLTISDNGKLVISK